MSASKGTVTANREKGKNGRLHHKFDGKCFNCGKKGHRAGDCRSAKKKSEKSGATDDKKEGGGSGRCYVCGSEEHLAHRHCGLYKSLEHRTRECEERGAEKGAMLAKLTVPVVTEVRAVAAMVGAARSDRKEEWESDFGATFHMSHTRAGMSAYRKASPGTNVEIADGNILPVDGFGRIEVDLDQPGRTTKMVKMDDVAYVPGLSRNLLSTVKAVEQWGQPLIYYRNKAVLGFPGEESLVFKFCPRRGLFSATGARRIPRQEVDLEENLTENGLVKIASGTALAMREGASRDGMEIHRMLAHPSEDITRKTTEMMGIETTGQWEACEICFQAEAKRHAMPKKTDERASVRTRKIVERQAVQSVDGPKTTGGDGTDSDDRGMKSAGDGTIIERGTPQLNIQELGQEQQLTLHEHETQEAFGTGSDDRGMKSAGDGTIVERGTLQLNVQELGQEQQLTLDEHETQEAFGTGSDDLSMKSAGGGTVVGRRGALQLEVQELELEQQPASSLELRKKLQEAPPEPEQGIREAPPDPAEDTQEAPDPVEETWEAPSDREDEAQGTPSYPEEETLEAPSDPEEGTLEAPSDPDEKMKYAAGLAEGPTDLEGPAVPASRKRTIGGNLPPNNLKAHVEPAGVRRRGRRSTAKFSADERGRQPGECVDVRRRGHDGLIEESGATGPDSEGHATGAVNRQKTMNALEIKAWRKVRRKKWKVALPNDKLVVRTRMIYKRKMKDGEAEKYRCRLA